MTEFDLTDQTRTAPNADGNYGDVPVVTEPDAGHIAHKTVTIEDPETGVPETVDPDYEVIVAANPKTFYDGEGNNPSLEETRVSRFEIALDEEPDHDAVMEAIESGFHRFTQDGNRLDGLIEKVYTRTVSSETALCVVSRGPTSQRVALSRLTLTLYESLRTALLND